MRRVGEPMNTWVDRISQACGLSDFVPFTRSFCNSRTRVQAYGMPGLNLAYATFRRIEVVQHLAHGLAQSAFVLAHLIILSENGFERLERAFQGAGALRFATHGRATQHIGVRQAPSSPGASGANISFSITPAVHFFKSFILRFAKS